MGVLKFLDCAPCLLRQALDAARFAGADEEAQERALRRALKAFAEEVSFSWYPARLGYLVHTIVKEETGCPDPYRELKSQFNEVARALYPELKLVVENSRDRFEAAVRLAIAGNIIDFAIREPRTVRETVAETLAKPFAVGHLAEFRKAVAKARTILYIGDNAGETFFDRLLIEELPRKNVVYAVKSGPSIHDATLEDAAFAGLPELVRVVDTGAATPGTILSLCSPEFRELFLGADLIIAKGQANYETLQDCPRDVVFLLRVKCPVIARDTGAPLGGLVAAYRKAPRDKGGASGDARCRKNKKSRESPQRPPAGTPGGYISVR